MNYPTVHDVPVDQLLQEPQGVWRGYITCPEDCVKMKTRLRSARIVDVDNMGDILDDFPVTPEAKMSCAFQLWQAITDYTDIMEAKDQKNHFQVDRVKAMSAVEVELLAWELLGAVENAHQGSLGFTVAPDGAGRKKTCRYSSFGSFGARLKEVKKACRTSKSIVYNLTTSPFVLRLAADPTNELELKSANKVLNDRRAANKKAQAGQSPAAINTTPAVTNTAATTVNPTVAAVNATAATDAQQTFSQPGSPASGTPQPAQPLRRVQAGRVAKGKQRDQTLSQHAAVAVTNSLAPQLPGPALPGRITRARSRGGQSQSHIAGAGSGAPSIQAPLSAGHAVEAGAGLGRPATLEEILQAPLDDTGDQSYRDMVKSLLRGAGEERRTGW